MIIIPIGSDKYGGRQPIEGWMLIALNTLIFFITQGSLKSFQDYGLTPNDFHLYTVITSMFIHADFLHLFFNMLFLFLVIHNLSNRLGPFLFLLLYFISGIFSALLHLLIYRATVAGDMPVVGASGAVFGVTGAFLIFYPTTRINFVYFIGFFLGKGRTLALIFFGGLFFIQLFLALAFDQSESSTAYIVHIFGFLAGVVFAIIIKSLLPDSNLQKTYNIENNEIDNDQTKNKHQNIHTKVILNKPTSGNDYVIPEGSGRVQDRTKDNIEKLIRQEDYEKAALAYDKYIRMYDIKPLDKDLMVSFADHLTDTQDYLLASEILEKRIKDYPNEEDSSEIHLRLGMIQHYLGKESTALKHLAIASQTSSDNENAQMAQESYDEIQRSLEKVVVNPNNKDISECKWNVIRQTDDEINISEIGQNIAKVTKAPLAEVTKRIRTSTGLLATDLSYDDAYNLSEFLQNKNIPVLLIESEALVDPPTPKIIQNLNIDNGKILFSDMNETYEINPNTIYFTTSCMVITNKTRVDTKQTRRPMPGGFGSFTSPTVSAGRSSTFIHERYYKIILEIFTNEPWQRFRFISSEAKVKNDYFESNFATKNLQNISLQLIKLLNDRVIDNPLRVLSIYGTSRGWKEYVFNNEKDYNEYILWKLQQMTYNIPE